MAKQLYDYWFVQFDFPNENGRPYKSSGSAMAWNDDLKREIPEEWNSGVFSDVANITMGQLPDGSSYNEDGKGSIVVYFTRVALILACGSRQSGCTPHRLLDLTIEVTFL